MPWLATGQSTRLFPGIAVFPFLFMEQATPEPEVRRIAPIVLARSRIPRRLAVRAYSGSVPFHSQTRRLVHSEIVRLKVRSLDLVMPMLTSACKRISRLRRG